MNEIKLLVGIVWLAFSIGVFAQAPPVTAVAKTDTTRLAWSPNPAIDEVSGYQVRVTQGSTTWTNWTTTTNILLSAVSTNIANGQITAAVNAVNRFGIHGQPSSITTNLASIPGMVVGLKIEATITTTLTIPVQ